MTVRSLAEMLGGAIEGDPDVPIVGLASLDDAGPGELTFAADARREKHLGATKAAAAIVSRRAPPAGLTLIRVDDVQLAVAKVLAVVCEAEAPPPPGVHPSAIVADDAQLGKGVSVGPWVFVGRGARIGDRCVLHAGVHVGANVTLGEETILYPGTVVARGRIGRRCRIGPNAVIGKTGFGYNFVGGRHEPVPHAGTVSIGDDVDIGACSCVDQAKFGATRIGDGAKIDNLVQIAHNVQIGRHCVLTAIIGIGGSAVLKDYVVVGGHVGIRDNITIGTGARIGGYSGVRNDIPDRQGVIGFPAVEGRQWQRSSSLRIRLPELYERIKQLEKKVQALESAKDH